MSTGADAKTMPQTAEFDANHERIFGKDHKPQRGRWIWDDAQQKLVPADEYRAPEAAINAPIMVDRFMEGSVATDGTDIGSRAKRREYMRRANVADASDYKPGYGDRVRAEKDRAVAESTKRAVADVATMNPRHIRKYIEEKK